METYQFILDRLPPRELRRYLLVGAWNTLFGYSLYALLTFMLTGHIPYPYMAASVLAHGINVTVAFLGYKHFVFRTPGSLLRQYLRCHVVYGSSFLINLALLPILVAGLQLIVGPQWYVPYLVGGVLTLATALVSFLAHKHFSFAPPRPADGIAPAVAVPAAVATETSVARAD